ncbi:tetratricopeptide repeat protein [candidate division KSB1 bacterium]|nr:tetratricopeptide repeat protein [candidate division KSB1 bacterium]
MSDSKTLLKSSIISIIIVVIGFFMLCVSNAPRVNLDEQLVDTGAGDSSTEEMTDDEFMNLLESADNEISKDDSKEQKTSESILLGEGDQTTTSEDQDLADLFSLLNLSEDDIAETGSDSYADVSSSSGEDELQKLLFETDDGGSSTEMMGQVTITELNTEVKRLEQIAETKDNEILSLNQAIREYDQQIAQLEDTGYYPGGGSNYATYTNPEAGETTIELNDEFDNVSGFQGRYDTALNYFNNRQYSQSINAFKRLLEQYPNNKLSDNCQYWIGECEFARGRYAQAIVEFQKVYSYDATDKWDDAQIMMALANMKMGQNTLAKRELSWFFAFHENSEYYSKARYYYNGL